ncbi:Ectopic P granules protein 5 [Trichostrongylus colubriformis]|uniref:Ectopic P granules protein 5 n=1 Tax=Trichostrongylus colubriformis TaxID=6319 RepID=A0AAN8G5L0_TRICO
MEHVITFVFHAFPANFLSGLDMALDGCNTGETPPALLRVFVERVGAENFETQKADFYLDGPKAGECAFLLARRLSDARSRSASMYSVWGRYMDSVTKLAQLFLFTPVREAFPAEAPSSVIQRDFADVFQRVLAVFSPLIVPVSASVPPFSPSNEAEAEMVLDRFVQLLTAFPHNAVLQPGSQNLPSLVWQFYFEKLSILSHGSMHYFALIERHFVRIPWPSFYPSERGIGAMDECLATRSPCCAPFVAQVVVRVMWKDVLTNYVHNELLPLYLSILFSVLVRIGSTASNYVKVRASMHDLVKMLSQRGDWSSVTPERAEELAKVVAVCLPYDSLTNPTDVVGVLQIIWRKICCFIVREPFTSVALLKQTAWLRTECALVLRGGATAAPPAYNSLIADVDALSKQHENLRAFSVVARELTALWSRISDAKFGESLVRTWNAYIDANFESPLVLMSLNTVIGSLNSDQVATALKVMENTIRAYFKRGRFSWAELMEWAQCPGSLTLAVRDYLLSVSSSNKAHPLMLTTAWFLKFSQPSDELALALHAFVTSIKPKHVWCEASFLLLIWQEVRWLADYVIAAHANPGSSLDDRLPFFMRWLSKAAKDESSFITNLITSKKTAHSPRLRAILTIVELYLMQQMMGESQLPRATENAPVLNSRIHALKEVASVKANQQFAAAFNIATPFFVQVDLHHIGSTPSLLLQCSRALFKEKFLIDT